MIDDKARIEHMIEHVRRIQTMLQDVSEEQFYQSFALVDGVSFNFAILGEAANKVSTGRCAACMRTFLGEVSSGCAIS